MIKLSQTGDDALKALCYIAEKHPQVVQIKEIVASQGMSEGCLRQIIANLNRAEILKTKQGKGGGIILAREKEKISMYDIFLAVGEEMGIANCTSGKGCEHEGNCYTTGALANLQRGFNSLLKLQTLDKIVK